MFKSQVILLVTLFIAIAMAAPITTTRKTTAAALNKRGNRGHLFHGRSTWFSDITGSCDIDFDQGDMIVAMNEHQMGSLQGSGSMCGKKVRVYSGDRSVDLKVVDTCPSQYCNRGTLDLSQAAFRKLAGGLSKGVLSLRWEFI
ncbi:hypothetical protein BGX26_010638 [Mortierella sp. AD094]|nr:hypothetical protein BGX26_010638 [Mortierella sp. AD094]